MKKKKKETIYYGRHQKQSFFSKYRFIFFLAIFGSIFCFAFYQLYQWQQDNRKIKELTNELEKETTPVENTNPSETVNPTEELDQKNDYWDYIKLPLLEVDLASLKQRNKDTIGFMHMDSTNINYPIVQAKDNDYYLTHAFDRSVNSAGWVFMDYRNNGNFQNDNTIIYGHGRLDTTVFGSLKNALTKKWQNNKNNYVIYVSTEHTNMLYQIFSIYTIPKESYYIQTNFASRYEKSEWLKVMKKRNLAPIDTSVGVDDHILTLSTCENNNGGRIVVQAKLIKKQVR